MKSRKINESTFTIVSNGYADGPAQALRDYLIKHKAKRVTTIAHPLVPEGDNLHIITEYANGKKTEKSYRLPHKPPFTYPFDLVVPAIPKKTTVWFGFNNLAVLRGLEQRKWGRTDKVVYWAVDFFADRFGKDSLATKAYNAADKMAVKKSNARVELSPVGVTGRNEYLGLSADAIAPTQVVPMGAWLDRTPKVQKSAFKDKKVVYLGHLVERQGVATLIDAIKILVDDGEKVKAEIIGAGPLLEDLKKQAKDLGIEKNVTFHGFVKDHKDVESILASGMLAAAPYKHEENFVQFADAGKLKAYLGAGLPIVLTDVPNNAQELQKAGAAFVVDEDPKAFAKPLKTLLNDEKKWWAAQQSAMKVAKEFDWNVTLKKAMENIGIVE
ncbi:MAG TPA: glycosyltransferase [Candidatus Saccharimonadales bacterium]|nr:glycosyltransferase [Candidatus Saccharimonadales bacterium]